MKGSVAYGLGVNYAGMMCLAIAINLLPVFLTMPFFLSHHHVHDPGSGDEGLHLFRRSERDECECRFIQVGAAHEIAQKFFIVAVDLCDLVKDGGRSMDVQDNGAESDGRAVLDIKRKLPPEFLKKYDFPLR